MRLIRPLSTGQQGFLGIGAHNPIIHTATVTVAWVKLFKKLPSFKEFVCIFFHDFGYISWRDESDFVDNHPELGARICRLLFGREGFELCIGHSREYSLKYGLKLSKLCFADKLSNLVLPPSVYGFILWIGGTFRWAEMNKGRKGMFVSTDLGEIRSHYRKWLERNWFWESFQ
jgi:hypothetical protein